MCFFQNFITGFKYSNAHKNDVSDSGIFFCNFHKKQPCRELHIKISSLYKFSPLSYNDFYPKSVNFPYFFF